MGSHGFLLLLLLCLYYSQVFNRENFRFFNRILQFSPIVHYRMSCCTQAESEPESAAASISARVSDCLNHRRRQTHTHTLTHRHTQPHRDVGTNRTLNLFWVLIFRFKIVRFNGRPGREIESSQAWSNRRTTGQTVSWPAGPRFPLPPSCRCLHKSRCCKHIYLETAHTNFAIGIFRKRNLVAFPQYNMGYSIK